VAAMFHEANHYLTDLVDEKFQYPHWLNEGMAEYYGASRWDPATGRMTVGHVQDGRLIEVRQEIEAGGRKRLEDLVSSEARDYDHYYWGWSFVHFMMESPKYQKRFKQFFLDLARARDVKRQPSSFGFREVSGLECLDVFKKRLGLKDADLQTLEREWWAHIEALEPDGVRGLELAGQAAYRQGRAMFRAPRLLKAAIDGGSQDLTTHLLYARCLLMRSETWEQALAVALRATQIDPLEPDAWATLGFCLHRMDRKEEGQRYVALAREMNPAEPYLEIDIVEALSEGAGGDR
jgi:tetratricopeptide (TPR) repeat protein